MGLGGLDSALSGLRVAQQQLNVISANISNASTTGYTRKILPQSAIAIQGNPLGVISDKIVRNVDLSLSRDFWTQTSAVSSLEVQKTYLSKIQEFHGDPTAETSVASALADLQDAFTALSDSPDDASLQRAAVLKAQNVSQKMNGFGQLINQMRNDAQNEMASAVSTINDLVGEIAGLNRQIVQQGYVNRTTASLEDSRDIAIQKLSEQIDITTFKRSDGALVVQTKQGVALADENAHPLYFKPATSISPQSTYPGNTAGIFAGDPNTNRNAFDLTTADIGGRLGALKDMRDTTLPRQQAEIDELAHKTAMRFDAQGLRLFTDPSGNIPADTAPVAGTTPVAHVGFASRVQVNRAIVADNSLMQKGTAGTDIPVQSGSNEVIRRITNFAFGDTAYQQAVGTVDVRANGTGATTLQQWLGLYSTNQITGQANVRSYADTAALVTAGGTAFASGDSFTLTFQDARIPAGPVAVTIDLSQAAVNFPLSGTITSAADQVRAEINAQLTAAGAPASLAASATVNAYGQLTLNSRGNITIAASGAGQMGAAGLAVLGLTAGTQTTTDPSFTVQVGSDPARTITIAPGETETSLIAKLQYNPGAGTGIPGLYVDVNGTTGRLTLRPGGDDSNAGPKFGGDITLSGGPFTSTGTGGSGVAAGASVLTALFGSNTPVTNVNYSTTGQFRSASLGAGANISTGVIGTNGLVDYAQKMVDRQTDEINHVNALSADEVTYKNLVQKQLADDSGVNIDEELSNMIMIQTAYSAAARVVSAIDKSFQDLLNAFQF